MKTLRAIALTAALLVLRGSLFAQDPAANPVPFSAALSSLLNEQLLLWAEDPERFGVSASMILPDGRRWEGAAGLAATDISMTPDMQIPIASITKNVTGAVILQLAEEGALSIEDRIDKWLPAMENISGSITIRQLLDHSAGLANFTSDPDYWAEISRDSDQLLSAAEVLRRYVGSPIFDAGSRTQYTNTGFLLLGLIVEAVTERPIAQEYRRRFWEPMELHEIFLPPFEESRGKVAHAWVGRSAAELQETNPLDYPLALSTRYSAFGLISSARDIAAWGRAFYSGKLLSAESMAQVFEARPAAGNIWAESGVGLGVRQYSYFEETQWGHSGGVPEAGSLLLHDPASGITVAVLVNQTPRTNSWSHFAFAPELLRIAREFEEAGAAE
jgi:D-alanyl-D-alanine carboxypeptidase